MERKDNTVNSFLLAIELAKTINREHQEEAKKHRLLQQVRAERPGVLNYLESYSGRLAMALALALRLQ